MLKNERTIKKLLAMKYEIESEILLKIWLNMENMITYTIQIKISFENMIDNWKCY